MNPQPVTRPRDRPALRARAHRHPRAAQRCLLGHRDRPRHAPAQPHPATHRRGRRGRGPRPAPQGQSGPLPGGHPDRDQLPGLPRLGVRGGQPRRRCERLVPVLHAPRRGRGERARAHPRDHPADAVHDRVRRARAQADRPCPCGTRGDVDGPVDGIPRDPVRPACGIAHLDHAPDQPAVRRRRRGRRADQLRGAAPDHRTGRRAGRSSRPRRSR